MEISFLFNIVSLDVLRNVDNPLSLNRSKDPSEGAFLPGFLHSRTLNYQDRLLSPLPLLKTEKKMEEMLTHCWKTVLSLNYS